MPAPNHPRKSSMRPVENAPAPDDASAHEVVRRSLHERVDLRLLPPPPASAAEWRERAIRLCDDMPGMRDELRMAPVGWFPLIEVAVLELRRQLRPRQRFCTRQLKEKFAALRWYGHVDDSTDELAADTGAEGALDWAEDASATVCALFGIADGQIDRTGGWLLTLSPRASTMRRESQAHGRRSDFSLLMYPQWDD